MNKNHLIIALAICLLLSMIVGSMIISAKSDQVQGLKSTNSMLQADIEIRKNREGKLLFEKQAAEIKVSDLPELAKQMARDFGVKAKDVRAYSQTTFQAEGKGNARIQYDSTAGIPAESNFTLDIGRMEMHLEYLTRHDRSMYYLYNSDTVEVTIQGANQMQPFALVVQDGYLDLHADVYNELNAPYKYTYSDTVKQAFIMRGKWWQKKTLYSSAMLGNQNARVINSEAVLVDQCKDKRWGIGPYIGGGINSQLQPQTTIGISIHYSLIKF